MPYKGTVSRREAFKATGNPFATRVFAVNNRLIYLTPGQHRKFYPVLAALENHSDDLTRALDDTSHQLADLRWRYEDCDAERESAVDGWYAESINRERLAKNMEDTHAYTSLQDGEIDRMHVVVADARQRINELTVQVSNLSTSNDYFGFIRRFSPRVQRYIAEYLKSLIPPERSSRPHIPSSTHKEPHAFKKLKERIGEFDFITGFHCDRVSTDASKNKKIEIIEDGEHYKLRVPYSDRNSFGAFIVVDTAARTYRQAELIKGCIEHLLR